MDADFIGTRDTAQALQRSLGPPWKLRKATCDDAGEQLAKVYATVPEEGIKLVGFLSGIVGLDTRSVRKRASVIILAVGVTVQLLHPLDVLESRMRNLDALPSRRNAVGVAQARLAVSVVRAFSENYMNTGGDPRTVRQAVNCIAYPRFHEQRWPRALARLERKREKFRTLQARRKSVRARQ
jgi:hypothetical protein